jgi:hypothetical protein
VNVNETHPLRQRDHRRFQYAIPTKQNRSRKIETSNKTKELEKQELEKTTEAKFNHAKKHNCSTKVIVAEENTPTANTTYRETALVSGSHKQQPMQTTNKIKT